MRVYSYNRTGLDSTRQCHHNVGYKQVHTEGDVSDTWMVTKDLRRCVFFWCCCSQ